VVVQHLRSTLTVGLKHEKILPGRAGTFGTAQLPLVIHCRYF